MSELKLRPSFNGSILPRWGAPFEAQDEAVLRPYNVQHAFRYGIHFRHG